MPLKNGLGTPGNEPLAEGVALDPAVKVVKFLFKQQITLEGACVQ